VAAVHTRAIGGRLMTFNEAWGISLSCHDLSPRLGTREFANCRVQSASPANSEPVSTEIAVREHMVRDIRHLLAACGPRTHGAEKTAVSTAVKFATASPAN
jgi:hypothetical protein